MPSPGSGRLQRNAAAAASAASLPRDTLSERLGEYFSFSKNFSGKKAGLIRRDHLYSYEKGETEIFLFSDAVFSIDTEGQLNIRVSFSTCSNADTHLELGKGRLDEYLLVLKDAGA